MTECRRSKIKREGGFGLAAELEGPFMKCSGGLFEVDKILIEGVKEFRPLRLDLIKTSLESADWGAGDKERSRDCAYLELPSLPQGGQAPRTS